MLPKIDFISVIPTFPFVYGDKAMNIEYAAHVIACDIIEKYTPLTRLLKIKYPIIPATTPGTTITSTKDIPKGLHICHINGSFLRPPTCMKSVIFPPVS